VDRTGRDGVGELPNGIRDPDGHAIVITGRCELVAARATLSSSALSAITIEHQGGGAQTPISGITS
jgi:hypothetical protein